MRSALARHRQFFVFLVVGGLSALVDVGLMQALIVGGIDAIAAASAGFVAGLLFNYLCHARLTFRSTPSGHSFVRYLCLVGINYLFTLACVGLALHLGGQAVAGKLVSLPIIAVNGYLVGKYWIFKHRGLHE